ncbi:MAG: hypothetical protein QOG31_738 [Thermoplasmata archaeon]|jgi:hypothetical protein|nr:hypothetical protein [Thermoplasmata archaeon]
MLRILLAAALLAAAVFAATPASAGPVCDGPLEPSSLIDQTWHVACGTVDCYFDFPAPACPLRNAGDALGYALCYGNTAPFAWVPNCT